jgi:preprotein translocase subunit SecE
MAVESRTGKMAKSAAAASIAAEGFMGQVKSLPGRTKSFYTEVRSEMKKVTTPTRKEVQATTLVVIITVFIFGLYFFVVDNVIQHSVDWLLRHFSR